MTDKGTAVVDDILDALETAGFQITNVGTRYRITNPAGGAPAFLPHRIPKGAGFNRVLVGLTGIGFDLAAATKLAEEKRKERLKAAQEAGAKVLEEATRRAQKGVSPVQFQAAIAAARTPEPPADLPVAARPVPRTEVLDITPTFARELLAANRFYEAGVNHAGRCNRVFRMNHAQNYADAMLRGEWTLGESIKFDVDQELMDGQHRLVGVVIAGETKPDIVIPFLVTYDMPVEAADNLDTGMRRTTPNQLQMRGEIQSLHLSAALRLLHLYDTYDPQDRSLPGKPYTQEGWRRLSFTGRLAVTMLDAEPVIRDHVRQAQSLKELLPQSSAAAGITLAKRYWPEEQVDTFVEALRSGANLGERDPIYALRETYLGAQRRKGRHAVGAYTGFYLAPWILAWNLHVRGKERQLRFNWSPGGAEPFPILTRPGDLRRRSQ